MKAVARAFGVSRSNLLDPRRPRAKRTPDLVEDAAVVEAIKAIASRRSTYGYRRACAVLNRLRRREGLAPVNHKRAYRLMWENQLLLQRHTGKPKLTHEGKVVTLKSDLRWCSDTFEIRCWSGERVQVAFSLDCCDREAIAYRATADYPTALTIQDLMAETVEKRFGAGVRAVGHPVEWLSDNGPIYTAHATRDFGRGLGSSSARRPRTHPRATGWPRPS